jgi:CHAT domain-containing protein
MGEGVQGLRYAFIQAGAQALLVSMFKVSDLVTAELMVHFYQRAFAGGDGGYLSAFREAQRHFRERYPRKPWLWGSFVIVGDPGR